MEAQSDCIFPSPERRLLHFRRSCSGCAVYVHLCVRTHTRDRTLPLCPSLHCCIGKEETPFSPLATQVFLPPSLVFPIAMLPSTTAPTENGFRNLPSKKKIPSQIPKVPPQLPPLTHLSGYCWGNWHPQPHLENRCRKRQRCTAYSFLHWRKRSPGPTIDLVFPPLPLILLAALPALFLLQFLACFFPFSLPSVRFLLFLLEGEPSS